MIGNPQELPSGWERYERTSALVGAVALAILVLGGLFDPPQFFRAYLTAYLFYFGIAMGCMVLLMIYHVTGGAWGFLIRRILEGGIRTLPLLALGFVPVAVGTAYLYPFAQFDPVEREQLLLQKPLMNLPFFWGRAALYFVLWLVWANLLNRASRQQDRTGDPRLAKRCDGLSSTGLLIYGITIHFASVDWLMSLQPAFHSTIFGPIVASGHLVSGLAFAWILLSSLSEREPLASVASPKVFQDLGNLLLAFVIVWTYMSWFQYMLVWVANLPVDVIWYAPRLTGGWQWVALALVILHFALPVTLLLWREVKHNPRVMRALAALLLFMQLVFMNVQVEAAFPAANTLIRHWMDFIAPIGLGGVWLAFFLWRMRLLALLPLHDHNQPQAEHLRRLDEREEEWEEALAHG